MSPEKAIKPNFKTEVVQDIEVNDFDEKNK